MPDPNPVARRRTFAIISHPDAGKTTPTDEAELLGLLATLKQKLGLPDRYRIEGWRAGRE